MNSKRFQTTKLSETTNTLELSTSAHRKLSNMNSKRFQTPKLSETTNTLEPSSSVPRKTSKTNTPTIVTQNDKKNIEHKINIAYSKYLQSVAWERIIGKHHQKIRESVNDQLVTNSKEVDMKSDGYRVIRQQLDYVYHMKRLYEKQGDLKTATDLDINMRDIETLQEKLEELCSRLYLEGLVTGEDGVEGVSKATDGLVEVTDELQRETNKDVLQFVYNVQKIEALSKKINELHCSIVERQAICDKMTLKAVSMWYDENISNDS